MDRSPFRGQRRAAAAALALVVATLAPARRAGAIDIELPGERQLEIHGWYELRLRFVGDDLPANGVTFSQFQHVLNLEAELPLFPDGVGPFDLVLAYARFDAEYECIYDHGCGMFEHADAYGGEDGRDPESLPRNVRTGLNGIQFVGGTHLRRRTDLGELTPPYEVLNPGGRPRGPINPPGVSQNPNPVSALANLNARSRLDSPTDQFAGFQVHARGAGFAGAYVFAAYVLQARYQVGEAAFRDLLERTFTPFVLGDGAQGEVRVLNTRIASALAAGRPLDDPELAAWITQRDRILLPASPDSVRFDYFTFDPDLQRRFAFPEVPQGAERNLLATRPDPNVFTAIARVTTPELLETTFGSHTTSQSGSLPYRATLGTPIRPLGYFAGRDSADVVNNIAPGVARGVAQFDVSTYRGPEIFDAAIVGASVAMLVGPDGFWHTADDLPGTGDALSPELQLETEIPSQLIAFTDAQEGVPNFGAVAFVRGTLDERTGLPLVLFGVGNPDSVLKFGCPLAGGVLQGESCRDAAGREIDPAVVRERGCLEITGGGTASAGLNAQGDCIVLNNDNGSTGRGVHFEEIALLSDPRFRPPDALREPFDLTDFDTRAAGRIAPPARPRAPGNTIAFRSGGTQRLLRSSHHLVSNLDLEFDVSELQWGHGGAQDENEISEAYLELETLDSQVFSRVGKQILVWGKTELFRGVDRWNPSSLSGGLGGGLEDSRIGQWGVDLVLSPRWAMSLGPFRDMRLELAMLFDDFEPTDLGVCGAAGSVVAVCAKTLGAMGHGLAGLGLVGEQRPDDEYDGLARYDYGARLEGHWRRFAFSVSDFWGWDDAALQEVVFEYERRVDPETGAPVNAFGPLACKVRTRDGQPVGPDGDPASTYDNRIPSVGNCLLFDPPESPELAQPLRGGVEIAANHSVNQTLFHSICSFTFDPDSGYCAFDQTNEPTSFSALAGLISGVPLTGVVFEGVETIRMVGQPPTQNTFLEPGSSTSEAAAPIVREVTPGVSFETSLALPPEQQALLGCGPAFVSPCGLGDLGNVGFASNPSFKRLVGVRETDVDAFDGEAPGGIDVMNADGGVLTQESTLLKALQPGALVGTRFDAASGARFESGVTVAGKNSVEAAAEHDLTPRSFRELSLEERAGLIRSARGLLPGDPLPASDGWIEPFPWKLDDAALREGLVLFKLADQTQLDPRCDPNRSERRRDAVGEPVFSEVEIAYCSRRSPNWASDPNTTVFNDGTDPTNPANQFLVPFDGDETDLYDAEGNRSAKLLDWVRRVQDVSEQCTALFKLNGAAPGQTVAGSFFDEGCTPLEGVSANYERFTIALEIIGGDRSFDPPETLSELLNMLDEDYADDSFGDPISGPDGIVAKNKRVFAVPADEQRALSTINDVHAVIFDEAGNLRTLDQLLPTLDLDGDGLPDGRKDFELSDLTLAEFLEALNPETVCPTGSGRCHAQVGSARQIVAMQDQLPATIPEGTALPVAMLTNLPTLNGQPVPPELRRPLLNMLELFEKRPLEFARYWAGDRVEISNLDVQGNPLALDDPRRIRLKYDREGVPRVIDFDSMEIRAVDAVLDPFKTLQLSIDGNPRNIHPLDQDLDGIYDGLDDGSPGPVSDDALLCGSGLPGDILQSVPQTEFYSEAEEGAFARALPRGLPRRSPVNCGGASTAAGGTGQTLPFVRAGGDGQYGRRDFQWHGGRELVLTYEKRNVLGFGLDFADDPSRTSWNMELSWENNLQIGDTNAADGLSNTDQYVLSVSVDRPTFFRFLNPSRTFFVNLQFYLRYLTDYNGGRDDRDGNFGFAEGPWSGQAALTMFTGYFQDRLTPRATLIWDPTTSGYGLAWGLGYRFRNNLTTDLRVSHFFGHPGSVRRSFYPNALYGDPRIYGESGRGFASAFNEDSAGVSLRYSW